MSDSPRRSTDSAAALPEALEGRDALDRLITRSRDADGTPPFSDGSLVELAQGERTVEWLGEVAAALVREGTVEFVVDPDARRRGHGTALLERLVHAHHGSPAGSGPLLVWAHGDHPDARALARSHGFERVRELLHLRLELGAGASGAATTDTSAWRPFRPGNDEGAWLELNAAAFAQHPEQGSVTLADLETLEREAWFDADDVLLLWEGERVIASCWLKVEGDEGEFYVVAVDPARQGEGLGRAAVEAGLARLGSRGIRSAHLYVEGDNTAALRLYRAFGFTDDAIDVQYALPPEVPLAGGNMTAVVRVGATVRRESGPWTPTVQRLLLHVRERGIDWAPEPLGLDSSDREQLAFIDGDALHYPLPGWVWDDATLVEAATRLRALHDATTDFELAGATWRQPAHEPVEVVCHNDFAPYNFVARDGAVVGVIDWDMASPGPRSWDLAYLAYRLVPLTTADDTGAPRAVVADRARRLDLLLASYDGRSGIDTAAQIDTATLLDAVAQRLDDLAAFSDREAGIRNLPDLARHAALYRADAAALTDSLDEYDLDES